MDTQLHLLTNQPGGEWRLDGATVEAGRRGLALARAALAEARRRAAAAPDDARERPTAA